MQVARGYLTASFPTGSPSQPSNMYANNSHGMAMVPASGYRSFNEPNGFSQHHMEKPQIYTVSVCLLLRILF